MRTPSPLPSCAIVPTLARIAALATLLLVPASGLEAAPAADEAAAGSAPAEVRFRSGELTLGGLLFVPEGEGPFPAAVFIRGSGPSARDNSWSRAFVDVFLDNGVAVLLPDKRGSDASEGDWRTASFDDLAGDALAAVAYVRARPDVRRDHVGLVGLSQGGKIAPIAAARSSEVAFVIDIVGSATDLREQVRWEMYHTFREAGVEGAALSAGLRLQVLAEGYLEGTVDWERYESARLAASEGPGGAVARGFPATREAWQWSFFRRIAAFDPIPHWGEVTQPVLAVYGEADHNAPAIASAYRLLELWTDMRHPDATVRIIAEAGHPLWQPGSDPHRPELHRAVVTLLGDWITKRTAKD
jgi:uncharacterized protein